MPPSNNLRPPRDTVIVSGYYGFNNLGDEAILEELVHELRQLMADCRIVVLSNNPGHTESIYGVLSVSRWDFGALLKILPRCRLFISGGGGLFQDVHNVKSVVYYGGHILLAHLYKTPVLIYAQGIGPLKRAFSRWFTRCVFKQAGAVSVRDDASATTLARWGIRSIRSADPVWCLQSNPLPDQIAQQLIDSGLSNKQPGKLKIGVCLREAASLSSERRTTLLNSLAAALPDNAVLVPLILQPLQDQLITQDFITLLSKQGRDVIRLDCAKLVLPSQWLELFQHCDLVISMRLHALIMALKASIPVIGLAYDPKVLRLMQEFDQPCINLFNDEQLNSGAQSWTGVLKYGLDNIDELSRRAAAGNKAAEALAKQNFELLATIIGRSV